MKWQMDRLDLIARGFEREIDSIYRTLRDRSVIIQQSQARWEQLDARTQQLEGAATVLHRDSQDHSQRLSRLEQVQLAIIYALGALGAGSSGAIIDAILAKIKG